MEQLEKYLQDQISNLCVSENEELSRRLDSLVSVYPFNHFEYIIANLLGLKRITVDDYHELRDEYIERNMFLYIFEINAPTRFGITWAQGHLKELVPSLKKPSRRKDPDYSGQYDFILDSEVRIEVKASRAVDKDSDEPLYLKALSSDSKKRFDMNFQQLKPYCCDVFIWMAVWRDEIKYWVLASFEVEKNEHYASGQHRGNVGEGQLHIKETNISDFEKYRCRSDRLLYAIKKAYERQKKYIMS